MEEKKTFYEEGDFQVTRTCAFSPPGCHPVGCGLKLYVKDGKLEKVEGDEQHPVTTGGLCIRCLTLKDYVYHKDRIIYPMKRDPKDRGKDKWERITWEEAYGIVASETKRIGETYGYETIIEPMGTGTSAGFNNSLMACSVLNTPNGMYMQSGYSCYAPRMGVANWVLGASYPEIDYACQWPDRYDDPRFKLPEVIMIWGKSPLQSNPDGFYGHSIVEMMQMGSKLIVIDPRVNWLSSRAEIWLQVRPGTDTALGMAMINYIIQNDLYDHDFVEKWTYGFNELAERCSEWTLEKAEEATWVPADKIAAAARMYATAERASLQWGLSSDQKPNGVQMSHCEIALMAITGNVDVAGGNTIGTVPLIAVAIAQQEAGMEPELAAKQIGRTEYPGFHATLGSAHADLAIEQFEKQDPFPVKMAFIKNSNLLSCTAMEPKRWEKVLLDCEFNCITDCFMTPTAMALADVFMPLATFAECDSLVAVQFGNVGTMVSAVYKAIEPVGECKNEWEVILELGKITNPDKFAHLNDVGDLFTEWLLKPALGITYDELRERRFEYIPYEYNKYETGKLRPDGNPGFLTPSGRIELWSTMMQRFGDDPLPYYDAPPFGPEKTPELMEKYPYVLTTGARAYAYFHSEGRQIPLLRETNPDPICEIHPETAAKHGIEDGNWVILENMYGSARLKAKVHAGIDPRVIQSQHGWWFPEEDGEAPNLYGTYRSNINNLIPHGFNGKTGFGAPVKCMICNVRKEEAN